MYANGEGVEQGYAKAIEWYQKVAGYDYTLAQCNHWRDVCQWPRR